jgi:hypothetical protein
LSIDADDAVDEASIFESETPTVDLGYGEMSSLRKSHLAARTEIATEISAAPLEEDDGVPEGSAADEAAVEEQEQIIDAAGMA